MNMSSEYDVTGDKFHVSVVEGSWVPRLVICLPLRPLLTNVCTGKSSGEVINNMAHFSSLYQINEP